MTLAACAMPNMYTPAEDYRFRGEASFAALVSGEAGVPTFLVPVRGYAKECSPENVEFVGIAA
jgi:hypothetical protein